MSKFKYYIALFTAKLSIPALRITGHKGTDFPGSVALKICPEFLKYIEKPKQVIGVTGTNGKTTISNLLTECLYKLGKEVLNNGSGSNTITGVVTSLIKSSSLFGRCKYDTAVFEIDERSTRLICPHLKIDKMIVANLSRDSIMRTGHPQYVRDILSRFISPQTELLLNADDLNASSVSPSNKRLYYGICKMPGDKYESENLINDVVICPKCHNKLSFEYIRYSNIGRAICPSCGFEASKYDFVASEINKDKMSMTFSANGEEIELPILNKGTFNIYNQVAVVSMLKLLGFSLSRIAEILPETGLAKTRYSAEDVNGRKVYTMLCKGLNGYAASRVFEHIKDTDGNKEILLMTNSLDAEIEWSEDLCWLYDADFELLNDERVKQIIVHGDRALDYRVRLLLAGIPKERITIVKKPEDGIEKLSLFDGDNIYVLYDLDVIERGMNIASKIKEACRKVAE